MNQEVLDRAFEAEEATAREARRAQFIAARQAEADQQARALEQQQQRAAALARCEQIVTERAVVHARLRTKLQTMSKLYEMLDDAVREVETEVRTDEALCAEHGGLEPLELELVRLAVGLHLGETWDDEPSATDLVDTIPARETAARLAADGSPLQFYRRLQAVQAEADHIFRSAPLHRWLAVGVDPEWADHSPSAERTRAAGRLLAQIQEVHDV